MYNINEKNNLDLDLAILSALLKGEMLFNTVIRKRQRTKIALDSNGSRPCGSGGGDSHPELVRRGLVLKWAWSSGFVTFL